MLPYSYCICHLPAIGNGIGYQPGLPAIADEKDFGNFSLEAFE
jgi:hypothetical protein